MRPVLLIAALLSATACEAAEPLAKRLGPSPVVVELFTSQGCSSCPPADALLSDVARVASLRGRVIPLAFHVDYWDRLGWRDPFSSPEWSRRQYMYVRALNVNSAYTPQMVVNGMRQFVGSYRAAIEAELVAQSHRKPAGEVQVTPSRHGGQARLEVKAKGSGNLVVVIYDNAAPTAVPRGENTGRTISNDAIVRRVVRAGTLTGGALERMITVEVDPSGREPGVAVFHPDTETLAISAATTARL
jgi:hypothetical protein